MIALPSHGFVMLSMPKCASTSMVAVLSGRAELMLRHNPRLKHMNARSFEKRVAPLLQHAGYRRSDYELVSLLREPVAWLESWWRYRQRPALASERPERYTGDTSFEAFAEAYVDGRTDVTGVRGRPAQFVARDGELGVGVDRLLCLERPEVWQAWLSERVGTDLDFPPSNVSSVRAPTTLSPQLRARLVEWFAPEYDLYARVRETGQWAVPAGYVAGRP